MGIALTARVPAAFNFLIKLTLCTALLLSCLGSSGDGGLVTIVVHDAKTNGPIDAAVILHGPTNLSDVTDIDGTVTFETMSPGQYTLSIRRVGYQPVTKSFTVESDQSVTIDVRLVKSTELRQIAVVTVRASNSAGAYSLIDSSAIRILSPSLNAALSDIAGIEVIQGNEPGAPQRLSIYGHDPTATAVSLDGIPLNMPGTAFNFAALDSDLLDRMTVGYGPSGSAEGGSVSLRTLDPTTAWQTGFEADTASFGRSFWSLSEQGTSGPLALAYRQAFRSNGSPLDNDIFEDSSGLTYPHAGDATIRGDALKLTYKTSSSNTLSLTSIDSTSYADALCTTFTNEVPCGYGPGNSSTGSFHLFAGSDAFSAGSSNWLASIYGYTDYTNVNLWNQVLSGQHFPFYGANNGSTKGAALVGNIPLLSNDNLTIRADSNTLNIESTAIVSHRHQRQSLCPARCHSSTLRCSDH
jgi:hypothetical protein